MGMQVSHSFRIEVSLSGNIQRHKSGSDIDVGEAVEPNLQNNNICEKPERVGLPLNKADYIRMTVAKKVSCYPFDTIGTEDAFDMVKDYFKTIGMDTGFHSVYEEMKLLTDYYEQQKTKEIIREKTEQIIGRMELLGIKADKMVEYLPGVLSEVFEFGDMEYYSGIEAVSQGTGRIRCKNDTAGAV